MKKETLPMQKLPPLSPKNFVNESPKFKYTAECIKSVIDHHISKKEDISGQVVYFNTGANLKYAGGKLNAFVLFRNYLGIERSDIGLSLAPRSKKDALNDQRYYEGDEIAIITGATPEDDRVRIKDDFNDGKVKVLLGSGAIKEGINLQKNSTVMYILQQEFAPATAMQLEGRIWRQGNKWKYVRIVYVLAFNSIDAFIYSKLTKKIFEVRNLMTEGKFDANKMFNDSIDPEATMMELLTNTQKLAELSWIKERKNLEEKIGDASTTERSINSTVEDLPKAKEFFKDRVELYNLVSKGYADYETAQVVKEIKKEVYQEDLDKEIEGLKGKKKPKDWKSKVKRISDQEAQQKIGTGDWKVKYSHTPIKDDSWESQWVNIKSNWDILAENYGQTTRL